MKDYRIINVQRRDEWDSKYGRMVTFALALEGESGWIKLNQKLTTPEPKEGDTITGDITTETTNNGESYRKFTKVNPKFAPNQQQSQASPQMDYIVQMLEELTGRRKAPDVVVDPTDEQIEDPFKGLGV